MVQFSIPEEVYEIGAKFKKAGHELYLVGGAVRDLLMGRLVDDWDFTTNATPEQIMSILGDESFHKGFGTVGYPAKDKGTKVHEITTFRREFGYSDKRRPDKVKWGENLAQDLKRRDFTINAIALELESRKIIDPHGGEKDLKRKIIRAVGEAHERFNEDALRLIRAIRIASQLNFKIETQTLEAIKQNAPLIQKIARERVQDELFKILASANPYRGILLFREAGLMSQVLPELEKTFGVEQKSPQRHHKYDVGTHSLLALKYCPSKDPLVRFATLVHDIGKPQTYKKLSTGVITFYNHEVVGTRIVRLIAERLKFSTKDKQKLLKLVRWHQFTVSEKQTDAALRRFIKRVGKENLADILDLRTADRLGGGASETSWRTEEFKKRLLEVQKQPFTVHDLKITGHEVMKTLSLGPGPKVGEILENLFREVLAKKIVNKKEALVKKLKDLAD